MLVYSFGGPEGPDEVMPFLERVTSGRVPQSRLEKVAEHYHHFGGKSPINEQSRALAEALRAEFASRNHVWPVYRANRHTEPEVATTVTKMARQGIERIAVFVTSAYGSYSGCRVYREEAAQKLKTVDSPPELIYCRKPFNQVGFIDANAENLERSWKASGARLGQTRVLFTAHSIPLSMAKTAPYQEQLNHACAAVAHAAGIEDGWDLVWQSRSGPPSVPWLEPDIGSAITRHHESGCAHVLVHPIGFLSDHMEVIYDLDIEAKELAQKMGIRFDRVPTVGTHPKFVQSVADSVEVALGRPPGPDVGDTTLACKPGCCAYQPTQLIPSNRP